MSVESLPRPRQWTLRTGAAGAGQNRLKWCWFSPALTEQLASAKQAVRATTTANETRDSPDIRIIRRAVQRGTWKMASTTPATSQGRRPSTKPKSQNLSPTMGGGAFSHFQPSQTNLTSHGTALNSSPYTMSGGTSMSPARNGIAIFHSPYGETLLSSRSSFSAFSCIFQQCS